MTSVKPFDIVFDKGREVGVESVINTLRALCKDEDFISKSASLYKEDPSGYDKAIAANTLEAVVAYMEESYRTALLKWAIVRDLTG